MQSQALLVLNVYQHLFLWIDVLQILKKVSRPQICQQNLKSLDFIGLEGF